MRNQFHVLAVLGRGIEQAGGRWRPTSFVEKCAPGGAHIGLRPRRDEVDETHPDCLIGGGNANVIAAMDICENLGAGAVLFAYGIRSGYLLELNAPSEGEVMEHEFLRRMRRRDFSVGDIETHGGVVSDDPKYTPSNTRTEIRNILDFAVERGLTEIAILTVKVHMPRTQIFTEGIIKDDFSRYRGLSVVFLVTENVLWNRSERYRLIVKRVLTSWAQIRNVANEERGILAFRSGAYASTQDKQVK